MQIAREGVSQVERKLATLANRRDAASLELAAAQRALARGEATPEQRASIAGLEYEIKALSEALREDALGGVYGELAAARQRLADTERKAASMAAHVEEWRAKRDAGLGDYARAARAALPAALAFLKAAGQDTGDAWRGVLAVAALADETIRGLASLPAWERQLADVGE